MCVCVCVCVCRYSKKEKEKASVIPTVCSVCWRDFICQVPECKIVCIFLMEKHVRQYLWRHDEPTKINRRRRVHPWQLWKASEQNHTSYVSLRVSVCEICVYEAFVCDCVWVCMCVRESACARVRARVCVRNESACVCASACACSCLAHEEVFLYILIK